MLQVQKLLLEREFAFSESSIFEMDRYLNGTLTATFHNELKRNFVAYGIEVSSILKCGSRQREKSGHWISNVDKRARHQRGDAAVEPTDESPIIGGCPAPHVP